MERLPATAISPGGGGLRTAVSLGRDNGGGERHSHVASAVANGGLGEARSNRNFSCLGYVAGRGCHNRLGVGGFRDSPCGARLNSRDGLGCGDDNWDSDLAGLSNLARHSDADGVSFSLGDLGDFCVRDCDGDRLNSLGRIRASSRNSVGNWSASAGFAPVTTVAISTSRGGLVAISITTTRKSKDARGEEGNSCDLREHFDVSLLIRITLATVGTIVNWQ